MRYLKFFLLLNIYAGKYFTNARTKLSFFLILFLSGFFSSCYYDNYEDLYPIRIDWSSCDTSNITFTGKVWPLIQQNCVSCHNNSSSLGNVSLEGYDHVSIYAQNGTLLGSIRHSAGYKPMPKDAYKLSECSILLISKWIDSGFPNN